MRDTGVNNLCSCDLCMWETMRALAHTTVYATRGREGFPVGG